jgi:hypothetical protein
MEKRIKEEKARITTLDSTRTPYLKHQIQSAIHWLEEAVVALRLGERAGSNYVAVWHGFAEANIQTAVDIRKRVQGLVAAYGGPEHVLEMGG